jgi:hypothetical protein
MKRLRKEEEGGVESEEKVAKMKEEREGNDSSLRYFPAFSFFYFPTFSSSLFSHRQIRPVG